MRPVAASIALALTMIVTAARAQDPQTISAAQVLFDDAIARMSKGRHAEACPKLEEAQRLLPDALGIKEQLGLCYEGAGRLASAWSEWRILEDLAGKASQAERLRMAVEHAAALRPRLATLTVEVPPELAAAPGLVVTRDGLETGRALWGTDVPVDKGSHEITATAPGRAPFRKKVEVADGTKSSVRVVLPVAAPEQEPERPVVPGPEAPSGGGLRALGIGALAVGAAGVAAGAILGGLAIAKKDESNSGPCMENNQCTPEGIDLRKGARALGDGSTAAIIAGGLLAAGGLTVVLLAPAPAGAPASARATVRVRAAPGGVLVEGRF